MTPLERFERYLTGEGGKSVATRDAYLADAQLLLELSEGCPLDSLTARDIRGFVRQMKQRKHDARTIARRLSAWRTWYRLLVREAEGFSLNPVASVRAPRAPRKLPRPVSVDGTAGFLDNLNDGDPLALRDRAMYELAYSSGLRVSELVGANLADLHPDATLQVRGKGGKSRIVPVGRLALAAIANWLPCRTVLLQAGETALFLNRFGRRMTTRAVQMRISNWSDKLGLGDKLHPHRLRHACASHFLQASGDLRATQELLGHASIATTQVYTHLDFNRLSAVYDQAHPRAKGKK
ncbi:tyrosine recombinase XerC [Chitinimonas sp. PSY-7]|uniref:tyrosine-type recombinase/integrase n=1 Tax=Chitinimonas sp. PSY-7 TaxID=3459088 RepID=UPI0040402DAE